MTLLRAMAFCLLLPGHALAQSAEQPLIRLQPATPDTAQPLAPTATPDAAQAPQTPEEPPQIDLAPSLPSGDAPSETPVDPINRDAGGQPAASVEDWLVAMVPAAPDIPTEVRIGGSMPAPGQFRLSGENASADFVLTLPDGVPPAADLLLSLRSSVNVLPDTSHLTVHVNGTEAGRITLDKIGEFSEMRVPAAAMTPGVNRIRLSVTQTHRIFCGPQASFAVWTEIDLGHSGVLVDPADLPLDAQGFLAAMQSQIARGGSVEILVGDSPDIALIQTVAGQITDALGGTPQVEVLPFYSMQSGRAARARVALIEAPQAQTSFRRGASGAFVLQIEYVAGTVPELSNLFPAIPEAGRVTALTPGRVTTLAELGSADIVANTHYFTRDVDFLLPEDWLLLASQKAEFTIHYGFSADLSEGALLLVKVNGQTIRLLPLDREGGKVQPRLDISFRANQLNPGINTLTLEMSVPGDPPDLPCTPRSTDMLVVLGDSTLVVPPSPKMLQADMLRSLARLGGADVSIPVEVANPARDTATLIAFGAALRPLVTDGTMARLHVVGLDAVGLVPTGDSGATRRMLQNAVYPATENAAAPEPAPGAAEPASVPAFRLGDADGAVVPVDEGGTPDGTPALSGIRHFFSTEGWLFRQMGGVRDLALPGTISLADWLEGKSGQALLLQLDPATPDDIWLVAGPGITMSALAAQVDRFRRDGRGLAHGQAALLQGDGNWVTWSERRRPALLEPLTPWNVRAVLGNYASWSPLIFTILTLVFALLSVIPALFFVLVTRLSGSRT